MYGRRMSVLSVLFFCWVNNNGKMGRGDEQIAPGDKSAAAKSRMEPRRTMHVLVSRMQRKRWEFVVRADFAAVI